MMNRNKFFKLSGFTIRGFTLIELLVVLAILGMLLTLVAPRYFNSVDKANEAVLKTNLHGLRDSIDKFYSDIGRYPQTLQELVDRRYIRAIPQDPITHSASSWKLIPATPEQGGGVSDVKSGAQGKSKEGTDYASW